jgi:hypothetical protein
MGSLTLPTCVALSATRAKTAPIVRARRAIGGRVPDRVALGKSKGLPRSNGRSPSATAIQCGPVDGSTCWPCPLLCRVVPGAVSFPPASRSRPANKLRRQRRGGGWVLSPVAKAMRRRVSPSQAVMWANTSRVLHVPTALGMLDASSGTPLIASFLSRLGDNRPIDGNVLEKVTALLGI